MNRISPGTLYALLIAFLLFVFPVNVEGAFGRLALASIGDLPASAPIELLHPKYKLPARCFAYVGDRVDTKTWKLPYLLSDGLPDLKRLPKAIQAVIGNYRGTNVTGIPERQLPDVLTKLGRAAVQAGKMPFQVKKTAAIYKQLEATLDKLGRLEEVKATAPPGH